MMKGGVPWLPRDATIPDFFGGLFLVLLRIAIGWHFLYEGPKILSEKVES